MRAALILFGLVLLTGLIAVAWRAHETLPPIVLDSSEGPAFEVRVAKPRIARPFFGLLPDGAFGLPPSMLRFDLTSPGAAVGAVEPQRLELRADGWDLLIECDGEGRITPSTRLVFPIELAEKDWTLCCRPAPGTAGYLRVTPREGSDGFDGEFRVELATCDNVATGKPLEWPPAPLTVHGAFTRLPAGRH